MNMLTYLRRAGALLLVAGSCSAWAQEYRFSTNLVVELPDGGGVGTFVQHEVSGVPGAISSLTISLDIAGTWSGDLYAYLNMGEGHAVLLNRVGKTATNPVGYSDHGFQVEFQEQAGDIHLYRASTGGSPPLSGTGALTGVWAPDGRTADPDSVVDTDPRTATLATFIGMNPNGLWTLFLADMEHGSVHELRGWGLTIRTGEAVQSPRLTIRVVAGGVEIRLPSQSGPTYVLEASDHLSPSAWQAVDSKPGIGGELVFGPYPTVGLMRTFRVRVESGSSGPISPRLTTQLVAGGIEVRLGSQAGFNYTLEASGQASGGPWQAVSSLPGTGSELVFGPYPTTGEFRAFRVRVEAASGG